MSFESNVRTIVWENDGVRLIDQTLLPYKLDTVFIKSYTEMAKAIKDMLVRGAPAIGIAGAFGVALAAYEFANESNGQDFLIKMQDAAEHLKSQRPTAVNLMWAVDRQMNFMKQLPESSNIDIANALRDSAKKILEEDIAINKKIGAFGAELVPQSATILTHCNAGALATGGYGTALGVVRAAFEKDSNVQVFADETRPRQQGARLTTWELVMDNIPVTLITDGMSGYFMSKGMIDFVVVGADRIAANGDTANKIGTYNLAIVAKEHGVPFYIAAPLSTIDTSIATGEEIEIEERDSAEVTHINGETVCAEGVKVINPGFDVTPARYIAGIITEAGVLRPDYNASIKEAFSTPCQSV